MKVKIRVENSTEIARKGNGRIFVKHEEAIRVVKDIIKVIDENEFEYMPDDFVAVFNPDGNNQLTYSGKFDLDVEAFLDECRNLDLYVILYSCNDHNYDECLTLEKALERKTGLTYVSDFMFKHTKE